MSDVTLERISKSFGSVRALDQVSLEVKPGELVALLGPSGCGKTTLLRSVAGLERPDQGRILIGGRDVSSVPTRERPIGMVFQSYALFPNMTVRQNVAFPLRVRKRDWAESRRRVDELLDLVGLTGEAERFPNQISGGQQQRTALARALAPSPAVLLLDEPLSALDALVRTRLRDEIRRIQQAVKITAIYVTHDQSEAMAIADQVAVMNSGRIEQLAQPLELYERPATPFSATFVGNRLALELPVQEGRVRLGRALDLPAPDGCAGRSLLFLRPEDVLLCSEAEGQPARLGDRTLLGSISRLQVRIEVDGQAIDLQADVPTREAARFKPGAAVAIRIDPRGARLFPAGD